MRVVFHANPNLAHQQEHAQAFKMGLQRHGLSLEITDVINKAADIHIVSGPWYAKKQWMGHPRVILIDRCYYRGDPQHISIGWMTANGGRIFKEGSSRQPPEIRNIPLGNKSIFLCDYGKGPTVKTDLVRFHPADRATTEPLEADLSKCNKAIGLRTTALVTAALMGLEAKSLDHEHILNQPNWLNLLPYADYSIAEIATGGTWDHLRLSLDQPLTR